MKKIFRLFTLIIGVMVSSNGYATEYNPYVAGRVAYVHLNNDVNQWVDDNGFRSTIADKTLNDENWGYRTAVGVEVPLCGGLAKSVRAEVEYGYTDYSHNTGSYGHNINGFTIPTNYRIESKIQTVMINAYYDLDTHTRFTPYVSAGVGYAKIKEKAGISNQYASETAKDTEENLAWQVGAGVSYAISGNMSAEIGYRYTDYGDIKNTETRGNYFSTASRDYDSHEVMLGLRYTF